MKVGSWIAFAFFGFVVGGGVAKAQSIAPFELRAMAGSGAAGSSDGLAARATFLMPSAVAFGPNHFLYVADAAAQRIREVTPRGVVRTLAGGGAINGSNLWVPGAFRDGAAASARFSHPSGLAVRGDGGVFVADTFNHCIRLIERGRVTTAAGRCGFEGSTDGPRSVGRLEYPRGLALAHDGTLYIADQRSGIRTLDSRGELRTIPSPSHADFRNATGIATANQPGDTVLYIADADRIVQYAVHSHHVTVVQDLGAGIEINRVQGGGPLGRPYSIGALSKNSIIYGDLRDGSVRYVEDFEISGTPIPHLQYVGGAPPEDAMLGLSDQIVRRFSAPMGIAVDQEGRVAIADAIQRKIIILTLHERRHAYRTGLAALTFGPKQYRIAIQGNSFVFFSSGFADSIAGLLEERLNTNHSPSSRPVKVTGLYSRCPDPELLAAGLVDLAILIVNAYNVDCDSKAGFERDPALTQRAGSWQQTIAQQYGKTVLALSRAHVRNVLLLIPMAWEISPLEDLYRLENIGYYEFSPPDYAFTTDYQASLRNWLSALQSVPAPIVNTFDSFRAFESMPHGATLFATDDLHLSKTGRSRVADALAEYLERTTPWAH